LIGENGRLKLIVYQTLSGGWDERFKGSEQPGDVLNGSLKEKILLEKL